MYIYIKLAVTLSNVYTGCHYYTALENHAREAQPYECIVALGSIHQHYQTDIISIHPHSLSPSELDMQNHHGTYKPLVHDLSGHDMYNKKKRDHCNKLCGNIKGCCMQSSEACDSLLKITSLGSSCYSPFSKNVKVKWVKRH